jgi:F420H(2)-dependent quinone reductase
MTNHQTMAGAPNRPRMRLQWRLHKLLWRLSGGRLGTRVLGMPVLQLTTTGHRSGEPRTILITYVELDGRPVIAGTNAGADRDPAWVRNLRARPEATILRRGLTERIRAEFLEGADWERAWRLFEAADEGYKRYRAQLTRPIPIVRLVPWS